MDAWPSDMKVAQRGTTKLEAQRFAKAAEEELKTSAQRPHNFGMNRESESTYGSDGRVSRNI